MIKAVLFDYFGVLTEGGASLRGVFAEAYGVSKGHLQYDWPMSMQALKGQVADEDFIAGVNALNADTEPVTRQDLEVRGDHPRTSKTVYELAEKLRGQGVKTGIVSNTLRTMADSLRQNGLYDGFSPLLLSCEVSIAKPDSALYRMAVDELGVDPSEIVFIDDAPANLEPAKKLGMHVILAKDPEQIVQDTKQLIFKENGVNL